MALPSTKGALKLREEGDLGRQAALSTSVLGLTSTPKRMEMGQT